MEPAESLSRMRDAAALWSAGEVNAVELVHAACDLLVAGFDGPNLCMLAGVHTRNADEEVPEFLEAALRDVGLDYYPRGSEAGRQAALRTMALRMLSGVLTPRSLAAWAHFTIGHGTLALADGLVNLDDVYDTLEYTDMTEEDVNADVVAEARQILGTDSPPHSPPAGGQL